MLASSGDPHSYRERSSSDVVNVDEVGGWASVAEALLVDCARVTLVEVAEPAARQAIITAYTDSLAHLVQRHLTAAASTHRGEVAHEERQSAELARQLNAAVSECNTMVEQLVSERRLRTTMEGELQCVSAELQAVQEEREALQAERAAVWALVRGAFVVSTHRRSIVSPAKATLEDHVRFLCDWVKDAEAELASATAAAAAVTAAAAPSPPATRLDEVSTSVFQTPRASYHRILPSAPLNPVTASLLRVKEQVRQLREPSVTLLQQAVGTYHPLREESWVVTTPPARTRVAAKATNTAASSATATVTATAATPAAPAASTTGAGVTPSSVDRSLGLSRSYTPHRSTASVVCSGAADGSVASPPWLIHMARLQEELKGLRRDLHSVTPQR